MKKPVLLILLTLLFFCLGCVNSGDKLTFDQEIEYSEYVGIIRINEKLSIFQDPAYNYTKIDYSYTETLTLRGDTDNRERIILVHSSEKKSVGSYCVFEENDLFDECYDAETEDYITSSQFYIVVGFYDDNNEDAIGIRLIELLDGYDESRSISEQNQAIQSIIERYTDVIDMLEADIN